MLKVSEIFKSIIGESTYAGCAGGIIRLSGCNLRCRYCDTQYAYDDFTWHTKEEIGRRIDQYKTPLILLTGGEPLLQEESYALMEFLVARGYKVLLETNGSLSIKRVPPEVIRIMDIKCPGSGETHHMHWENLDWLTPSDEVKFVITNRNDFTWATEVVGKYQLGRLGTLLFSPAFGMVKPSVLADWILEEGIAARLQLQLHKLIWGEARGR
jgi:7-carboxy-7-deazaguanine synthase